MGDGDFGYSMARGFELVLQGWDDFDRADIGTFLKKIAIVITSRIGGTSGPIWGTAFLRAGATAGAADRLEPAQIVAMLRAATEGIKARGKSDVGDKTLLDALVPAVDTIEEQISAGHDAAATLRAAAATARSRAEATRSMQAMRGGPATPANAVSAPWTRAPSLSPSCSRHSPTSGRSARFNPDPRRTTR